MYTKLIGYSDRKQGEFNGVQYDNINLHTVCDAFDDITGVGCSIIKVKFAKLPQLLDCPASEVFNQLNVLLGKEILMDYVQTSRGAQLCSIRLKK